MNLKSIEYFLITAEEMNFSKAAKRLFISQQALSSHIQRLEEEYGVQLFERHPTLRLTLEGKKMVNCGKQIMLAEKRMRAAFSDISENCRYTFHIGISRLRGSSFIPTIWRIFHRLHPNISLDLADGNSAGLDNLLQAGKLDMYIGIDVPSNPNEILVPLATERIHCCMTHSFMQSYYRENWESVYQKFRHGVLLEDIADAPLIYLRSGNRLRTNLDIYLLHRADPNILFESNQHDIIYDLVKNGSGIGVLSPAIFYRNQEEIKSLSGQFFARPLLGDIPDNTVYLVYRKDYSLPQYAKDFILVVQTVFEDYAKAIQFQDSLY